MAGNRGIADGDDDGAGNTPALKGPRKRCLYDPQAPTFNAGPSPARGTPGPGGQALSSVRHGDGGHITVPMHLGSAPANRDGTPEPDHLPPAIVRVGMSGIGPTLAPAPATGDVFAEPPDEHRDLPHNLLAGDRTGTITAWAVHGDDEVVGPGATLKVRPVDTAHGTVSGFHGYRQPVMIALSDLVSTEYTVLK